MRFWKSRSPKPGRDDAARTIAANPLVERTVVAEQNEASGRRQELNPEEACGEMRAELRIGRGYPGRYQRARLALFVLRKFHDPGMAASCILTPSSHGEYLKSKDSAFINRCNIYDFYKAADRYLRQYERSGGPEELRCFCEHFLKVERFERLHSRKDMSDSDERRLAQDRLGYLRALNGMLDRMMQAGRLDRIELEAAMEHAGRFLPSL